MIDFCFKDDVPIKGAFVNQKLLFLPIFLKSEFYMDE